ncbi:MAG TPA: hypothetical protein VFU06_11960, partial [Longimicrobiales bacterium]|nr:hypothetical protein [Longimicrobiales bacterium]
MSDTPEGRQPPGDEAGTQPGDVPHAATDSAAESRSRGGCAALLALGMLLAAIIAIILIFRVPEVTVSEVDMVDLAHTTLQQEISAAFLVTGELIVTADTRVQNTKTLLPGLLDVDL